MGKARIRFRLYLAMLLFDTAAVIFGFVLANILRFGDASFPQGVTIIAVVLPLFWAFSSSGFVVEYLESWRSGLLPAFIALLAAIAIVLFLGFYLKASTELSRLLTVMGYVLSCAFITAGRAVIGVASRRMLGGSATSELLVCDDVQAKAPPHIQVMQAGELQLEGATLHPVLLDRLARSMGGSDIVYISCSAGRRPAWAAAFQGSAIHAEMLIPELKSIGVLGTKSVNGVPTLLVSSGPLRHRDMVMKRTLDLALVIPALLFLAPLMISVALAIKLTSKGPIFFVQRRVGFRNKIFHVFKFRSMRVEKSDKDGAVSASRDDDRITTVGKFIRSTSIDELPQLLNILLGEMSFVGPRPHAIGSMAGDQLFWEVDSRYHHRHACKPGLTGLAQVRGYRGATHRREDLINRLHADLEYLNGWSVRRDLSILLATVKVVVHRNAF